MSFANDGQKELCHGAAWKAPLGAKSHCRARAKLRPGKYTKILSPTLSYDQDVK
jgi:hypothetical protein